MNNAEYFGNISPYAYEYGELVCNLLDNFNYDMNKYKRYIKLVEKFYQTYGEAISNNLYDLDVMDFIKNTSLNDNEISIIIKFKITFTEEEQEIIKKYYNN